ncbi:Ger(x)C family spore germination protein [Ornithinibacillus sp. 179-J 7C1 HS]|uniref:Ger(x)C family spore germination protein n=1 Tax=Ornithinibacillus sp. 179-J 7C1 HS TaxID=3142384 RepID=UPI0039A22AF1
MRIILIILFLCTFPLLSSCLESAQLEDLGVITSRGVDLTENNQIKMSLAILQFQANYSHPTTVVKGVSETIKGAREDANQKVSQQLVPGKLQLEIYGKELAEKGVNPFIDTLVRDAAIPDTMLLAVAEENAEELFDIQVENISTNLGEFLYGLLQPTTETHQFPSVTLHRFGFIINNEGIDPILPIIGVREDIPTIVGIALFKDDIMKGQLPIEDEHLLKIIDRPRLGESLEVILPIDQLSKHLGKKEDRENEEELKLVFLIEHGSTDIILTNKEKLTFDTNVNLDLSLQELSTKYNLDDPKAIKGLEKAVEQKLKTRYEEILKYLKELNTDVFGYGMFYRLKNKGGHLTDKEWDGKFPNIDVTFNIDINIIRHGTTNE